MSKKSCHQEENLYICPMHPEVESDRPGSCPKCGMALEAKNVGAEEDQSELLYMTRRFLLTLLLTLPVMLMDMGRHFLGEHAFKSLSMEGQVYSSFLLTTLVVLWGGWPFFLLARQSLVQKNLNMFTLIALGSGITYLYSSIGTFFPQFFPSEMIQSNGFVPVYFESAAMIVVLVLLGQVMELKARSRTNFAIRALLDLSPKVVKVIRHEGQEEEMPICHVKVGEQFRVRLGESVPLDGVVVSGKTSVDESMISGEAIPVAKNEGDWVTGGTVNQSGSIVVEAKKVGNDTLLAKIVELLAQAQRSQAPVQKLVDQVSSVFVPVVLFISSLSFFIWFFWGPEPQLAYALVSGVSVLMIACPCALGLATPMSLMVGMGRGAQEGVLIKDAISLELMERVDVVCLDKTGTLTEGKAKIVAMETVSGWEENTVLQMAASVETGSTHPLAFAILEEIKERSLPTFAMESFSLFDGLGVSAFVQGKEVKVGNKAFVEKHSKIPQHWEKKIHDQREHGASIVFIAIDESVAAWVAIKDPVKKNAKDALEKMRAKKISFVLLSGDHKDTVASLASDLGIDQVHAEVLPQDKCEIIKGLQEKGHVVAMVGDGINDAPALATANVGIAMGSGTDIAMQSAEVTLLKGDLNGLNRANQLSRECMKNIRMNLFFAFIYNALGISVAAGLFYPILGVLLSPVLASAAMICSSLSVILNALRLQRVEL